MMGRAHANNGRSIGRDGDSRARKLDAPRRPFFARERAMYESPAFIALPDYAMRLLLRIELEHLQHGGKENGRLKVTYSDFAKYGLRRSTVAQAIVAAEAAGFLERTFRGRKSWGDAKGAPGEFRLTSMCVRTDTDLQPPTRDWEKFRTIVEAKEAIKKALDRHRMACATKERRPRVQPPEETVECHEAV